MASAGRKTAVGARSLVVQFVVSAIYNALREVVPQRVLAKPAAPVWPDGYTLIYTAADTHSLNPHVFPKITYDARQDFTPVAGYNPFALVVHPGVPADTLAQFIALARQSPGKLTYASWGIGSSGHTGMQMREQLLKSGLEVASGSPQEFKALLDSEWDRWGRTIREAGIKAE